MKSITILFVLFISIPFFGQNENDSLLIKYHPNKKYIQKGKTSFGSKRIRTSDKETTKYFDSVGLKKKLITIKKESLTSTIITKNRDSFNNISVEISLTDYTYFGKINKEKKYDDREKKDFKLIGKFNSENKLDLEKLFINSKESNDILLLKARFNQNNIFIYFPKFKLEIDKSFKLDAIIKLPSSFEIPDGLNVTRVFTLKKVMKNIAYFEIKQILNFDESKFPYTNLKLTSVGTMKYDIENNFILYFAIKSSFFFEEEYYKGLLYENTINESFEYRIRINNFKE